MFTALILACNTGFTECRTFMYPEILQAEGDCMDAVGLGIMQMESIGMLVKDYQCVLWSEDT